MYWFVRNFAEECVRGAYTVNYYGSQLRRLQLIRFNSLVNQNKSQCTLDKLDLFSDIWEFVSSMNSSNSKLSSLYASRAATRYFVSQGKNRFWGAPVKYGRSNQRTNSVPPLAPPGAPHPPAYPLVTALYGGYIQLLQSADMFSV